MRQYKRGYQTGEYDTENTNKDKEVATYSRFFTVRISIALFKGLQARLLGFYGIVIGLLSFSPLWRLCWLYGYIFCSARYFAAYKADNKNNKHNTYQD